MFVPRFSLGAPFSEAFSCHNLGTVISDFVGEELAVFSCTSYLLIQLCLLERQDGERNAGEEGSQKNTYFVILGLRATLDSPLFFPPGPWEIRKQGNITLTTPKVAHFRFYRGNMGTIPLQIP